MRGPALHTLLVTLPDPTPNVAAARVASARANDRSRAHTGEPAASPDGCDECGAPLREEGEDAPHDGCPGCGERGPAEGVRVSEVATRRQLPSGGYQVHNGRASRPVVVG